MINQSDKYGLFDVTPIPRNQNINLAVLNQWCYTHPNKSEIEFYCNKPTTRRVVAAIEIIKV